MTVRRYLTEKAHEYIVMTRSEVRDFDTRAIKQMHNPGVVLM